jgi:2'-5' RNA ligase
MSAGLTVRTFVAIELPPRVRDGVSRLVDTLERKSKGAKWVERENLHLTIKFLGNQPDECLQRLDPVLAEAAGATHPFTIALGEISAFPSRSAPRVVWLGLAHGAEAAVALHGRLDPVLGDLGIAPEDSRPFRPHVTLARARGRAGLATREDFFETLVPPDAAQSFRAESLVLYMSELTRTGPIYSVISRMPFGSQP